MLQRDAFIDEITKSLDKDKSIFFQGILEIENSVPNPQSLTKGKTVKSKLPSELIEIFTALS